MSNKNYLSGNYVTKSDIGKIRLTNEDRIGTFTNTRGNILMVVCDGMGGQNKGEYAAEIALRTLNESFMEKSHFLTRFSARRWLLRAVIKANKAIFDESEKRPNYHGMGTTLTVALILNNYLLVGQIGDSRAYILRNRQLIQLTEDQTYVGYLYRTGKITLEETKTHPQRHVLMNALGILPSIELDMKFYPYNNESVLVCSDGLYNNVEEKDILSILKSNDSTEQKVNELISLANANGGSDNIAVGLWEANK